VAHDPAASTESHACDAGETVVAKRNEQDRWSPRSEPDWRYMTVLRMTGGRRTPFVCIDESEHRIYFGATRHTRFFFTALQRLSNFIVPAAFAHEFVPDINFIVRGPTAFIETPGQNFIIAAALFYALNDVVILDAQKFGAELIKTSAEVLLVIGRKLVFLMRPNFVEHASKINEAADFCRWAANAQLVH
jgi:hypothetical protein